jgi:amylosucrase
MRISGMAASLAGLEQGLEYDNALYIDHAIRRLLLIHSVIISIGGIPLIYLNDEVATLNDYSYEDDPNLSIDNRWVHRPVTDWDKIARRYEEGTIEHRVFSQIKQMIDLRKSLQAFADGNLKLANTHNNHVLGYMRNPDRVDRVLVLSNFSEHPQYLLREILVASGLSHDVDDLIAPGTLDLGHETIKLDPYQYRWITKQR